MVYKHKLGFARPHNRDATATATPGLSMTKQSFVDQCDINNILKQFKVSGMLQHVRGHQQQGTYQDLPDSIDFQESLHIVMDAQKAFASLPSKLRNRFDNDPAQFLEFMADPSNEEEIYKLGLAKKLDPVVPLEVKVVNEPPSSPGSNSGPEAVDKVPPKG